MFCPVCKAEYRQGFTRCSDCQVALVNHLPQESDESPEYVEFKPVLSTYSSGDIAFIKSILDSENIEHFFKGENFHSARPGVEPAILMVRAARLQDAIDILKDVNLAYLLISTHKSDSAEDT